MNLSECHNSSDRIATTHDNNSGNYVSVDGSVTNIIGAGPNLGPRLNENWFAKTPNGVRKHLDAADLGYGNWGTQ